MAKLFDHCMSAYQKMLEIAEVRNGLWLEANGYEIDFLTGYQDAVPIFFGKISSVITPKSLATDILGTMRACGWLVTLRPTTHALLKEPNEDDFYEYKDRTSLYVVGANYLPDLRTEMYDRLAELHNRIDELERRINDQ